MGRRENPLVVTDWSSDITGPGKALQSKRSLSISQMDKEAQELSRP